MLLFLYAVATVDVLMANSNNVNLAKTRYAHLHISDRINKLDRDYSYWQILSLDWPLKIPRNIAFNPLILQRVQRWRVS